MSEEKTSRYKPVPYLENTKAPVELLGLAPLLTPFSPNVSSQRGMMFSNHLPQAQCIYGAEMPKILTGYEPIIGDYEFDTTKRDCGIQIEAVIPKFKTDSGMSPIRSCPYYTIVFRQEKDNKIGYFHLKHWTLRSDGYGYKNVWLNTSLLTKGNYIPPEVKLCTSPIHKGSGYGLGTNLRCAYMSIPQVTEDAVVISETAAKKLGTQGVGKISFKILPNQLPLNLYGTEDEYKFLPEVGEFVHEDGILAALRTPTPDSFILDVAPENLTQVQHMHDSVFYVPPGSEIVDIDVHINRDVKIKVRDIYAQAEKYRVAIIDYYRQIWEVYQEVTKQGLEITPAFNTLVTTALGNLMAEQVRINGYSKPEKLQLVRKKEAIEFIYVTVHYAWTKPVRLGAKLTGRVGNKGVVSQILPDSMCPVDDYGIRADIIMNSSAVFNRMNTAQWIEQDVNRTDYFVLETIKKMPYKEAFNYLIEYLSFINPKWGELTAKLHNTDILKQELINEVLETGMIHKQVSPFQEGTDQHFTLELQRRYPHPKTPVTFSVYDAKGNKRTVRTRKPVCIGDEYIYILYKTPHQSSAGVAYVNQFHAPIRPSKYGKMQYPFSQTPIRLGEDEGRNITMVAGSKVMARLLGMYANSPTAVEALETRLIHDPSPSTIQQVDVTTKEAVNTNTIIGVTRHIFSCLGIDIAPQYRVQDGTTTQIALPEVEDRE